MRGIRAGGAAVLLVGVLAAASALAGADQNGGATGDPHVAATDQRQPPPNRVRSLARDARLTAGRGETELLRLPRIGTLRIRCTRTRMTTAFTADRLLPTSDVVLEEGDRIVATTLQPERRFRPDSRLPRERTRATARLQTWQIAPFAPANVTVTSMTVALRRLSANESFDCAASAQATLVPAGTTLTG